LPWDDASPSITDLSGWNQPIDAGSRVIVDSEGHFSVKDKRIRFVGMNFAGEGPFTPTNKADAVAARVAKFGINCIRFHHMDAPWALNGGLIDYRKGNSRQLNPKQLALVHYLVARLKAHGVYANINLLVGREFQSADGLPSEVQTMDWKDQHVLGFFNDAAYALHQEYATQLLAPINPFTGLSLAQDPAVAFVEIMNENGMIQKWFEGALDRLPAVFSAQLQARWNNWLATRYASDNALSDAWKSIDQVLGPNLLKNGTFASGTSNWTLEEHQGADATFTVTREYQGQTSARIEVVKPGAESWHIQLNQPGLRVTSNQVYTFSFYAKASGLTDLNASLMQAHADWAGLGYNQTVRLTTNWQLFKATFLATSADANARPNFGGFATQKIAVWLADVRFQAGGQVGVLPQGASLANRNVPNILRVGSATAATLESQGDWLRFLSDLERNYWLGMTRHVRETCGYGGLVFGTIIANSPPNVQAAMDVVDGHAYWQHPQFPVTPWDAANWYEPNVALVNTLGGDNPLASLAQQRVKGKPFTVTEYQHPSPNYYGAEGPLLLAAYGALQDWDGLWLFEYGRGNDTTGMGYFHGFFDTAQHPTKMANLLLAAAMFRRLDIDPAQIELTQAVSPDTELNTMLKRGSAWSVMNGGLLGVPGKLAFMHRLSLSVGANAAGLTTPPAAVTNDTLPSDTGQLIWNLSQAGKGFVIVNTPRTKAVTGFVDQKPLALGGITLQIGSSQLGWASAGLTLREGASMTNGARLLLVLSGQVDNTGQRWLDAAKSTVGTNWGRAPVLAEVVPFRLVLPLRPEYVKAFLLDDRGQRRRPLPVLDSGGQALLAVANDQGSLWYEIWTAPSSGFGRWQFTQFDADQLLDPNVSGAEACLTDDQWPNLLKCAFGLPAFRTVHPLPFSAVLWPEQNQVFAAVKFDRATDVPDVELTPEISSDLTQWSFGSEALVIASSSSNAAREQVIVRDRQPLSNSGSRFFRLKAQQLKP
jgi:hypothetical protein